MAYDLWGSTHPVEGSRHAPISVAASFTRLRESAIRDYRLHVAAVLRIPLQGHMLINQKDGVGGHPEGARGALQFGGDRFQGIAGLEICV